MAMLDINQSSWIWGYAFEDSTYKDVFSESVYQILQAQPLACWFTSAERNNFARVSGVKGNHQGIGHLAVKRLVSTRMGVCPTQVTIDHYPSGVPRVYAEDSEQNISLSHTKNFAAAITAPSDVGIGIDLAWDTSKNIADMLTRTLTKAEHNDINAWTSVSERSAFFHLWTLKEAALKAWGIGMRIAPWDVETTPASTSDGKKQFRIVCLTEEYPPLYGETRCLLPGLYLGVVWSDRLEDTRHLHYWRPRPPHLGC